MDFFNELPLFPLKAGHILTDLYGSDWDKRLEVELLVGLSSFLNFFGLDISDFLFLIPDKQLKELQENVTQLIDLSK